MADELKDTPFNGLNEHASKNPFSGLRHGDDAEPVESNDGTAPFNNAVRMEGNPFGGMNRAGGAGSSGSKPVDAMAMSHDHDSAVTGTNGVHEPDDGIHGPTPTPVNPFGGLGSRASFHGANERHNHRPSQQPTGTHGTGLGGIPTSVTSPTPTNDAQQGNGTSDTIGNGLEGTPVVTDASPMQVANGGHQGNENNRVNPVTDSVPREPQAPKSPSHDGFQKTPILDVKGTSVRGGSDDGKATIVGTQVNAPHDAVKHDDSGHAVGVQQRQSKSMHHDNVDGDEPFDYSSFLDMGDDDDDTTGGFDAFNPDWTDDSDDDEIDAKDVPPASFHSGIGTGVIDESPDLTKHEVRMRGDHSRIDMDALTRTNRDVARDGYSMDSDAIAEGTSIGKVKQNLKDIIHTPHDVDAAVARSIQILEFRKKRRIPFSKKIPKAMDFLTRWRYATTFQIARAVGWRDTNENRLVQKLRVYEEIGWLNEDVQFAGPRLWYVTNQGAGMGMHSWLGGTPLHTVNPQSQSHSIGLTSIASWLLCPRDDVPNVLGLDPYEWVELRRELRNGDAKLVSEKEFRSTWSSIRVSNSGLLPAEYRHGFIGYPEDGIPGAWRQWAVNYKNGMASLADSPEYDACDVQNMGENMWMWVIWGNYVWNPTELVLRAEEDGIDIRHDPKYKDKDERARILARYREYGYVHVEDRLDVATNRPKINREMGDAFSLLDHLPDLLIARKRDPKTAASRNIAIELEIHAKSVDDYARTMASFGSPLGKTLYDKVLWIVPNRAIANRIEAGARKVGMVLGDDYQIVPFTTQAKRNSFYSGADILPGEWNERGFVVPGKLNRSISLS